MPAALDYESIAKQIHEFYREKYQGTTHYEELAEFMKVDNREAAYRIGKVLSMAGLRLEPLAKDETWTAEDQQSVRGIITDNLEVLAETEHEGWMEARIRQGWVKADHVNRDRKESHLLVPYAEFEKVIAMKQEVAGPAVIKPGTAEERELTLAEEIEHEKNKDRDAVSYYVGIIAETQYRIIEES